MHKLEGLTLGSHHAPPIRHPHAAAAVPKAAPAAALGADSSWPTCIARLRPARGVQAAEKPRKRVRAHRHVGRGEEPGAPMRGRGGIRNVAERRRAGGPCRAGGEARGHARGCVRAHAESARGGCTHLRRAAPVAAAEARFVPPAPPSSPAAPPVRLGSTHRVHRPPANAQPRAGDALTARGDVERASA